ncbi:MAG: YciI family protein [Myxococcota bacterium]|nr:YciI family protein [Myxococcota bacterium]
MGLYAYIGRDGPRGAELRKTVRERHIAHIEALDAAGRIVYAGPLRGADEAPCGSLIVLEADDFAAAEAIAQQDPYTAEGVFERVDVHGTQAVFPKAGQAD